MNIIFMLLWNREKLGQGQLCRNSSEELMICAKDISRHTTDVPILHIECLLKQASSHATSRVEEVLAKRTWTKSSDVEVLPWSTSNQVFMIFVTVLLLSSPIAISEWIMRFSDIRYEILPVMMWICLAVLFKTSLLCAFLCSFFWDSNYECLYYCRTMYLYIFL